MAKYLLMKRPLREPRPKREALSYCASAVSEEVPFVSVLLNEEIDISDSKSQYEKNENHEKTMTHNYEISFTNKSLNLILSELQTITNKIKSDEDDEEKTDDCKFAAMVIDRLCLVFFSVSIFLSTVLTLFSAKNFFKFK